MFTSEELKYLKEILGQASSYAIAKGEQIDHPSVKHKTIIQKIDDLLLRMYQ